MCAIEDGFALHYFVKLVGDHLLCIWIKRTCCLVKQENFGFLFEKASCDDDSLSFTTREFEAKVSYLRVIAILHSCDLVVNLTFLANLNYFFLGCIRIAIFQVVHD